MGIFPLAKSPPSPHMFLRWLKVKILRDPARNAFLLTCGPRCPKFTFPIVHPSHDTGLLQTWCSFGFTYLAFAPVLGEWHVGYRDHRPDKSTLRDLGSPWWAPLHRPPAIIHTHKQAEVDVSGYGSVSVTGVVRLCPSHPAPRDALSSTFSHPAIINDTLSNYSTYTDTIIRGTTFANSPSLGRSSRAAYCLFLLGSILQPFPSSRPYDSVHQSMGLTYLPCSAQRSLFR